MRQTTGFLAIIAPIACGGLALAQGAATPDLKGSWVGASEAVILGKAPYHSGGTEPAAAPKTSSAEITLTIEGQDGRRFWGAAASQHNSEPIVGVIGYDAKTIRWQTSDGASEGTIVDPDTIEILYSHATADSTVAAVNRYKRRK